MTLQHINCAVTSDAFRNAFSPLRVRICQNCIYIILYIMHLYLVEILCKVITSTFILYLCVLFLYFKVNVLWVRFLFKLTNVQISACQPLTLTHLLHLQGISCVTCFCIKNMILNVYFLLTLFNI